MRADLSTCQQIQCGAITQEQAGMDLLLACSEAGYVGARSCADQICSPFMEAMIANHECPSPGGGGLSPSMLDTPIYKTGGDGCLGFHCGVPGSQSVTGCGGYFGDRACTDVCIQAQLWPEAGPCGGASMPKATSQVMPRIVDVARRNGGPVPDNRIFGPDTILNPMPRIVTPPREEMPQVCGTFASWVSTNPVMAGVGLVALYFVLRNLKK